MSLSAEFDSPADRRAYAVVAAGAAALSYDHARTFFLPFMGAVGASVTPLMLDAVVFWLASANVRQARAGRPLPMLRAGAYALLALTVTANALGGATPAERVFLALPAALFGFLVEARTRLALYQHRAVHGDDRLRLRLWVRHPVRTARAWLWLGRQSAPAFDRASAERDRLCAARDAVRLALPGRSRAVRRARVTVLRELTAGRLTATAAVAASGLLTLPGVPALHRAALAASLGGTIPARRPPGDRRTGAGEAPSSAGRGGPRRPRRSRRPVPDVDGLMPLGWQVAADLATSGQPLTRDSLAAGLRAAGHPAGNARVGALLARLKAEAPADPADTPDLVPALAEGGTPS
jgi:hypothetical protein